MLHAISYLVTIMSELYSAVDSVSKLAVKEEGYDFQANSTLCRLLCIFILAAFNKRLGEMDVYKGNGDLRSA